jgi:hypothetical protein
LVFEEGGGISITSVEIIQKDMSEVIGICIIQGSSIFNEKGICV